MRILLIDNYDSFTYNLLHILKELCAPEDAIVVAANDRLGGIVAEDFDKVIISPGPGIPSEAGGMPDFIRRYGHRVSMLGVCLGHHAIAEVFGARLVNTPVVFHGVRSRVELCGRPYIFDGLPDSIEVGRYHSWVVSDDGFPDCLRVTARAEGGEIMALSHVSYDLHGVQFHPESIMTPCGRDILKNFLFH